MFEEYPKINVNYENLNNITIEGTPVFLTVKKDNVPFEFLINDTESSDKAVIFGSGAYDPKKMNPPIFNRFSWKDRFDCTTIWYNDPTLYLGKINLGWGYGSKDHFYLDTIAKITKAILNKCSIKTNKTLFFGSSGGGFTSIALATMLKGSKAFVNNPQTIIENYYETHVANLNEVVYGSRTIKLNQIRSNLVKLFENNNHVPEIYYAQNLAWKHDMNNHLLPFINGLNELNPELIKDKIDIHLYSNKEQGHRPMDNYETLKIIKRLLNTM